jgi:hypothetical protein
MLAETSTRVGCVSVRALLELAIVVRCKLSPTAQRRELVAGLQRVFAARVAGHADLRPPEPGEHGVVHATFEHGCATSDERLQLWTRFTHAVTPEARLAALARKTTDPPFDAATIQHDHALYILCPGRRGLTIHALTLQRDRDSPPFTDGERDLVEAFYVTCRELLDMLAELDRLPRRCHPPFELILRGMSEKAIASELGLSIHTVHEYVKLTYNHFGVSSRGELTALWLEGAAALGP